MSEQNKPDLIAEVENSEAGLAITPAIFKAVELLQSALALEKKRLESLALQHEDLQAAATEETAEALASACANRAAHLAGECRIIASYLRLFQDRITIKDPILS